MSLGFGLEFPVLTHIEVGSTEILALTRRAAWHRPVQGLDNRHLAIELPIGGLLTATFFPVQVRLRARPLDCCPSTVAVW